MLDAARQKELSAFGDRVSTRRALLGMSKAELAELCGLSTNAIHSIESGASEAKASTVRSLSIALQCSTEYLLMGDAEPNDYDLISQLMAVTRKAQSQLEPRKLEAFIKQSRFLIETLQAL